MPITAGPPDKEMPPPLPKGLPPLPTGPPPVKRGPISDTRKSSKKDSIDTAKGDKTVEEKDGDGWDPYFDANTQRYFFYNRFTKVKQWLNPRVPKNDAHNQNLPEFPPPELPFEEPKDEYTRRLRLLKEDVEFNKLTTYEKYKQVEALKRTLQDSSEDSPSVVEDVKDIAPFSESTNFHETNSRSHFAQDLNAAIRHANSTQRKKHKVTKKQAAEYTQKKKEQRQKKRMEWLTKD